MLTPLVFLPLATVLINDVRAEVTEGALTVEIATSDPVDTSSIRVATGGQRRLFVYLDDSAARRPSFGEGAGAIMAHPRARYTKLEIPTSERCGEPIGVSRTTDGVLVRASCRDGSAAKGAASAPARVAGSLNMERPLPDAPKSARTREPQAEAALRAALALPSDGADDLAPAAGPMANAQGKPLPETGRAKASVAAKAEPREPPTLPAPRHDSFQAASAGFVGDEGTDGSAKATTGEKSSSATLATFVAAALLLGAGGFAFMFARKRVSRQRVIRIVETASIGPRRSLVVASVGGRTMVLGVSEAGVSLLDAPTGLPAAGPVPKAADVGEDSASGLRGLDLAPREPAEEAPAEAKHESSLLGRLFRRKPREAEGLGGDDFERLFAESMEDEELRRKLALGQSGRIA